MKFTVEFIEMNWVQITFTTGEKFFYSLDEMSVPQMVEVALSEYEEL